MSGTLHKCKGLGASSNTFIMLLFTRLSPYIRIYRRIRIEGMVSDTVCTACHMLRQHTAETFWPQEMHRQHMAVPVVLSPHLNNMTCKHMGIKAWELHVHLGHQDFFSSRRALHRSGKHLT